LWLKCPLKRRPRCRPLRLDLLQRERDDADSNADHGRRDPRVGAHPRRRSGHGSWDSVARSSGGQAPLSTDADRPLRRTVRRVRGITFLAAAPS